MVGSLPERHNVLAVLVAGVVGSGWLDRGEDAVRHVDRTRRHEPINVPARVARSSKRDEDDEVPFEGGGLRADVVRRRLGGVLNADCPGAAEAGSNDAGLLGDRRSEALDEIASALFDCCARPAI